MDIGKDLQQAYDDGYAQAIVDIKLAHKPQTNADRIRAMGVEELAEWRSQKFYVPNCAYMECPEHDGKDDFSCTDCWLAWLKEEVKDG